MRERPIEVREVDHLDPFRPKISGDQNKIWFRMPGAASTDARTQHLILAYASDMSLMSSVARQNYCSIRDSFAPNRCDFRVDFRCDSFVLNRDFVRQYCCHTPDAHC
ncbi:hypothetical protein [Ruegeria sp.]|uniref:hypothetical protein n=1 Tax=Ruegeria sp. TaxID=1879320 RepID=UPI003B00C0F2